METTAAHRLMGLAELVKCPCKHACKVRAHASTAASSTHEHVHRDAVRVPGINGLLVRAHGQLTVAHLAVGGWLVPVSWQLVGG